MGGVIVGADAKNLGVVAFKFCNTSLVCSDFAGSTTGESGGEERQHHGVFSAEAGKRDLSALGGGQSEVWRHVAFLQRRMWRRDVLGEKTRREQTGRESKWLPHGYIVLPSGPGRGILKMNIGLFKT